VRGLGWHLYWLWGNWFNGLGWAIGLTG
jgi:hypothetical protein